MKLVLVTNSNPFEEANQYCSSAVLISHLFDEQNSSSLAPMILYEQDDFLL